MVINKLTSIKSGNIAIKTPVDLTGQRPVAKGAYLIDTEFAKRSEPEE